MPHPPARRAPSSPAPARRRPPCAARLPSARTVEGRRHGAPQRQRGVEAGGRRPRGARAHRVDLRRRRLREHRPDRPARPLPLVGPLHAAQAGHRRRQDRHARAARARGRVLHAPRAHRRRAAHHRAAPRDRAASRPSSAATPPTSPTGRTCSCTGSASRTCPRSGAGSRRVGLATTEACGDVPRVVLGSPGRRHRRRRAHRPHAADRRDHRAATSATPSSRTCPASSRRRSPATPARTSCTRSTTSRSSRVDHPELGIGYDLWVGGGLSTARRGSPIASAPSSRPSRCADVWLGVASIFRDYGYRRLRNKARLKFLLADWGAEKFREVLETEYLGAPLPDGPRRAEAARARRPRRRAPPEGRPLLHRRHPDRRPRLGLDPRELADLLERARVRAAAHDAAPEARDPRHRRRPRSSSVIAGLDELGLHGPPEPHPPRHDRLHRHRVLQARDRRDEGDRDDRRARPRGALAGFDLPHPISLHVNGCPNSCARIQTADIGLKGQLLPDDDGEQMPGLPGAPRRRTRLGRPRGGRHSAAPCAASRSRPTASPTTSSASCAASSTERDAAADETFAEWAHRADEEVLR